MKGLKYPLLILISLLFGVSDGSYSSLTQNSRFQSYYPMIMCNSSQSHPKKLPPVPLLNPYPYPGLETFLKEETVLKPDNINYFTPTILNYSPKRQRPERYDEIGLGNRMNMPSLSSSAQSPDWFPYQLVVPNQIVPEKSIAKMEDQQNLADVNAGVRFFLFTRTNPVVAQQIFVDQNDTIQNSHFNASRPTKLIFHGFTDVDAAGDWVNKVKEAYLSASDVNILVADYSAFSLNLLSKTKLPIFASKRLMDMFMFLENNAGVLRESFHLVARSSACHVVGMTGRLMGGQIGRITCLEPSEKIAMNGAPENKLVREDAQFVDIIHINGKSSYFMGPKFGMFSPSGHVDIYPNIAERGLGCPGESISSRR